MYYNPTGHLAISTLITAVLIGIGTGIGVSNGHEGWQLVGDIFLGGILGGLAGWMLTYYAGPTIASLLANSGGASFASLAFAGGGSTGGGLAISLAGVGQIALAGTLSIIAIKVIEAAYMFAKPNSRRIRFSHDIDKNPDGSKMSAKDAYHNSKDPKYRAELKKWMNGKGYRKNHLKGKSFGLFLE